MSQPVEGFEVPVHQALTQPILLGGAPRGVAIINGTLAANSSVLVTRDGRRPP